jgi:hypothetical protein
MSKTSVVRSKTSRKTDRRRAPPKSNPMRAKVSVALSKPDLAWAEAEAKKRKTSLSAVFAAALQAAQRDAAWDRCFAAMGGVDDITDEDRARVDAEFRENGLIP